MLEHAIQTGRGGCYLRLILSRIGVTWRLRGSLLRLTLDSIMRRSPHAANMCVLL
jgi:hypothetical protein